MERRLSLVLLLCLSWIFAEIPHTIMYQGKITDPDGIGINDMLDIQADFFTTATAGSSIWSEIHNNVNVEHGLFSILIGGVTPLDIDFSSQLYMQLTIDGEIMTPRIKLNSEASAIYSAVADSIAGHSSDEDNLADNFLSDLGDVVLTGLETGQTIVWDGDFWVPGDAAAVGIQNTDLYFNDGTNQLSITDIEGTLSTFINNEADNLTDNMLDDLMDVQIDSVNPGRILVYNGTHWVPGDPGSATDNQIDTEVPTTSTGDFEFAATATNVHDALDYIDNAIGNLDDGNPVTTRVSWYDLSSKPPGFADDADAVDDADHEIGNEYNTSLNFSDATDILVLTDGGGALSTAIDNEADDLTDNVLGDIGNIIETGVVPGNIIQFNGSYWVAMNQTDAEVDLSLTSDFALIGGTVNVHGALDYLDNAIYSLSDSDTATTAIKWADIRSKPTGFRDNIDNVDDADHDPANEFLTSVAWDEHDNELTISDDGDDHIVEITGFSEDDHAHEDHIAGDGLTGYNYDGSESVTWNILTGRGLEIYLDSIRLDDAHFNGDFFEDRFISTTDTACGDIAGYFPELTVRGMNGRPLTDDEPSFGSLISWDGLEWNYTPASLMWGDSVRFIRPLPAGSSPVKIYDVSDSFMIRIEHSDDVSNGRWYGMKLLREGNVSSKGYGIYSYAGAYADLGADTTVSEFWGVYGKAAFGKRNYGIYGIANDVGLDCQGYGVYGEGQTAGGWFYGPENDGEKAVLKVESPDNVMLLDGDEISSNGSLYLQKNGPAVLIGGGLAIGPHESADAGLGYDNSIQLATSFIGDDADSSYSGQTGALIYADQDGGWGTASLNIHMATGLGEYDESPALKIGKDRIYINPENIDDDVEAYLTVRGYGSSYPVAKMYSHYGENPAIILTWDSKFGIGTFEPEGKFHVKDDEAYEDQRHVNSGSYYTITPGTSKWQSFTAGIHGDLKSVRIGMLDVGTANIIIREGEGLSGTILATQPYTWTYGGYPTIFFDTPPTLVKDEIYTIEFANVGATDMRWTGSTSCMYLRGQGSEGNDFYFITYMVNSRSNLVFTSSARLGVGTSTPEATLDVNGTAYFSEEVGIGTSSPVANLDVHGTVSMFGTPTEIVPGTEYLAETDGFLILSASNVAQFIVLLDDRSGLTQPADYYIFDDYAGSSSPKSITCPIPKGYYYKVIANGGTLTWYSKLWIPIGK